ncbi:MAG: IclR family transcriptional regulator [Clostridia bacterium]|nr:IclR family transcriptional regulator [Clostridia bacterium]
MANLKGPVQALDRAFTLVEIIANSPEPLSLKKITELAGLPKPTVYRILSSLEIWGYVEQDNEKMYRLGTKLMVLGNIVEEKLEIRKIARPFLEKLNQETKETVFLGVLDKGRSLYIDKLESHYSVRLFSRIGTRNYVHSTSLGKCLLSELKEEVILEILRTQGMPRLTPQTITDPQVFLDHLREVRAQGYALDQMENEEGVCCIAAPIRNYQGKIVAAVSISGPIQRITNEVIENLLKPALLTTVNDISKALGFKELA